MTNGNDERPPRPTQAQREFTRDYSGEKQLPEGSLSVRRFLSVMGVFSGIAMFVLVTFLSLGLIAGATLGVGIGGFVAEFENVSYTDGDAEIYPVQAAHPTCEDAPQLEASLAGNSKLTGNVSFFKDLPLPDTSFSPQSIARITILANSPNNGNDPIQVTDLNLRLTALDATTLNLGDTVVREFGPNQYDGSSDNSSFAPPGGGNLNPNAAPERIPEYGINASTFSLPDGGKAAAHQVSFSSITLTDLNLFVAIDDKSNFTDPVERVVEPTNRTCQSLVDAT